MTYNETTEYLYNVAPAFTKVGASAYKEGLTNTEALDAHTGHPHRNYLTIHVAGTNGKGSTSHMLAAILQSLGLKVGLFTSPHLVTFRERMRVNGEMVPEDFVVSWVEKHRAFFEPLCPSFFELTTAMAFDYFAQQEVDIAVIEVGLGGRLDCTNIISPILSVITNISFDHTQFLGDSLAKIAYEKAGIIKDDTPVVIGEYNGETRPVFQQMADEHHAPIIFAQDNYIRLGSGCQLKGLYQEKNIQTVLNCLVPLGRQLLRTHLAHIMDTPLFPKVRYALENVCDLTGLQGRWQILDHHPLTICDTGHNVAGWEYLSKQIRDTAGDRTIRMVFGMVDDKDIDTVMSMLPEDAIYYFTQASTHRAIPADRVAEKAQSYGLKGKVYSNVKTAYEAAKKEATHEDFIFIGGSSYVVADLLTPDA